jgi:hypothetical protein
VIAHPELVPEVLRQQIYRILILFAVLLQQISHGLDNQALSFDIPWISQPGLSSPTAWIWNDRNGEDSGHGGYFSQKVDTILRL